MYGMLIDVTKCTGCEQCVAACVAANGLSPEAADRDRAVTPDGLSANRFLTLQPLGDSGRFARRSCMHCLEPSCVSACLVGSLEKTPSGAVVYDGDKCIGCRYCMLACPFHVPRYEWDTTTPKVKKCHLCHERLGTDGQPACVEACPNQALAFGDREQLLAKARGLLRDHPDRYIQKIWGESEWGGTSLLSVSDVDLTPAGWSVQKASAIPDITGPLIEKTPWIGLTVGASLLGLSWIIRRRNEMMALKAAEVPSAKGGEDGEVDHD